VVEGSLVVDLSDRTLSYHQNGEEVVSTTVAIGTEGNPTPTGSFFVTDNVTLANPASPWGPHALGLSARSDTITEFNGGDGIVGIHGTNRPESIGEAASLGCVRVPNEVIIRLHELVRVGTPVEIRA
jgi:lipoprotein-anchoring transpeptidase ErfK/SrfK